MELAAILLGIIVLVIVLKMISLPLRIIKSLVTNSILGAIMLFIVQIIATKVEITFLSALIAGFFGIPGVIGILVYTYLL